MNHLQVDLRQTLRGLARSPVLSATIVLTVGLGIGATTAMFSVIHAVLLAPLPYTDPARLVRIYTDAPPNRFRFSVADYQALEEQQTKFQLIAGYTGTSMTFTQGDVAERLTGRSVSWGYFTLLGLRPLRGRLFDRADGEPGSPRSVVVSDVFAERRLGGAATAVGRSIRLDRLDYAVVGVLPRPAGPLEQTRDVFTVAHWETPPRRGPFFITVLGRLRGNVTPAVAGEELRAINRSIFPLWQSSYQDRKASWAAMDLKAFIVGDIGPMLAIVQGAVAFLLLIACTNAANLLVARAAHRRRELAVRSALGASKARLLRYLMTESALLALGGALVGVAIALGGIAVLRTAGATSIPRSAEIGLTGPVLTFLAATTAAAGLLFGLIPALHGAAVPIDTSLRSGGRSSTAAAGPRRLRRALVMVEFAVATPLLIGAGLLLVSLVRLERVDLGIDRHNVATAAILLPREQYPDSGRVLAFWNELESRIAALPGVGGLAFSDGRPAMEVANTNNFELDDEPTPPGAAQPTSPWVSVTPAYFGLMKIPLQRGRLFDRRDGAGDPVVIVDRAWAARFSRGRDPIGRRLHDGGCAQCPPTTIVGVVGDVKYGDIDKPEPGTVYWPVAARPADQEIDQLSARFRFLVLRTRGDPGTILPEVRRVLHDLDPAVPLTDVATIDDLMDNSLLVPRYLSLLLGSFAGVALLLSAIGIYGVMSYFVEQHTKDIGIRIALGGAPGMVSRMVIGQGMHVASLGIAVGVGAAFLLTRLLSSMLFDVGTTDPRTFFVVSLAMLGVALVSCLFPARRAAGVDPSTTLREE